MPPWVLKHLDLILAGLAIVAVTGYIYHKGGEHKEAQIERRAVAVERKVQHEKDRIRSAPRGLPLVVDELHRCGF